MALHPLSHSCLSNRASNSTHSYCWKNPIALSIGNATPSTGVFTPFRSLHVPQPPHMLTVASRSFCFSNPQSSNEGEEEPQGVVQELRLPDHWLVPSKALQESEWLRITLHKWLDDEYCPETTNVEISRVASQSFYESLLAKQCDLGEVLLKMAMDLGSISYQESFHGAFSSANAAVSLIVQRIEHE